MGRKEWLKGTSYSSLFSGCSWNRGHWWTVVHFWNSISVSGLNFPSCVCCKCQIISSTTYHKHANLKVLQLKPISPLEQNHGNRGVYGGEWVSFPMWMSATVCKRSWAGVKAGTQNGSTRAAKNMSAPSGDQLSPYQTHVRAADQDHGLCFSNHLMLTWNPFADPSVLVRWASVMLVPGIDPLVPLISPLSSIPFARSVCCRSRMLLEVSHPPFPSTLFQGNWAWCCSQPSVELTNRNVFTGTPPARGKAGGLGYSEGNPRMDVFPVFPIFLTAACLQLLSRIFKDALLLSEL